jgi:hypothetical protein
LLYFIDTIKSHVNLYVHESIEEDVLDTQLLGGGELDAYQANQICDEIAFLLAHDPSPCPEVFEVMERKEAPKARPSIEEPPSLELKELPAHLEYAYLDDDSKLHVIISSNLTGDEKEKLLEVLKTHKKAMAWKIMDIKGINHSFCTQNLNGGRIQAGCAIPTSPQPKYARSSQERGDQVTRCGLDLPDLRFCLGEPSVSCLKERRHDGGEK